MWNHPDVCKEWLAAGEERGQKVHMSRNFDGKPYVTHTEMRAMAEILTSRYFKRLDVVSKSQKPSLLKIFAQEIVWNLH
jgi:hypothetical protein